MTPSEIRARIAEIGLAGYRDGSSTRPGIPYQPIPFPEFADVPSQKRNAVAEYEQIKAAMRARHIKPRLVLDVGANVGYFSFNLARDFQCSVLAVEADPANQAVLRGLAYWSSLPVVELGKLESALQPMKERRFQVALMLNVHHWIEKQRGAQATFSLMRRLARQTDHLFFQTAHAESHSFYRVASLRSPEDIAGHLDDCGFEQVEFLGQNDHKGPRYLFYAGH